MADSSGNLLKSLASGAVGAATLTAVHETARRVLPNAPRMDTLGRRGLVKTAEAVGVEPPSGENLQSAALGMDLLSNSVYYALVGAGGTSHPWLRGGVLGALAGLGAVALPPVLGLGRAPRGLTRDTQAMTVAWYLIGGLAAAAAYRALTRD